MGIALIPERLGRAFTLTRLTQHGRNDVNRVQCENQKILHVSTVFGGFLDILGTPLGSTPCIMCSMLGNEHCGVGVHENAHKTNFPESAATAIDRLTLAVGLEDGTLTIARQEAWEAQRRY